MIEAARNLADIPDANSTEFDPATAHPVISTMAEQLDIVAGEGDMGGTMRLGMYPAKLAEGSIVREVYDGKEYVEERHRHRYEVNNAYRAELEKKAGLLFSGTSPDGKLVEYVEYPRDVHPYLVATQAHPELRSRPDPSAPAVRRPGEGGGRAARSPRGRLRSNTPVVRWPGCGPSRVRAPVSFAQVARWKDAGMTIKDTPEAWEVRATQTPFVGNKTSVRTDEVVMPDGSVVRRDYQVHPGSVAVLALDDEDRVLLIKQYRHPVRHKLWEIPAGLLDVPGENPLHAAQRELYEEAHVKAEDWRVLTDVYTTPGGCDEAVRIFLARELSEADGRALRGRGGGGRHGARAGAGRRPGPGRPRGRRCTTTASWSASSSLAAARAGDGLDALRPAEAPWPARPFEA